MYTEDNRFLGGHLVGIGIGHKNGEVEYRELDKPIHNRITSVGLDHLFLCGGTNKPHTNSSEANKILWTGYALNYGTSTGYRTGALQWCALGSGTTATAFTDTALVNKTSTYYNTKYTNSSDSSQTLNGTKMNSFGNWSFRISHQSPAVSETTTINEIGWFGGYGTNSFDINSGATPVLFARVVLPNPITLQSGEYLITTYQLDETCSAATAITGADFFGLKDTNGNTLQYEQKLVRKKTGNSVWGTTISEPYISISGEANVDGANYCAPYYYPETVNYSVWQYTLTSNVSFPTDGNSRDFNGYTAFNNSNTTYYISVLEYAGVGSTNKYRDRTYLTGAYNPGMASNPESYKDITGIIFNGMAYRFGYYDNGVWTPQAWRKYANKQVTFTFRTRYSTPDTTNS